MHDRTPPDPQRPPAPAGDGIRHPDDPAADAVTEASEESFPASDAPSWTPAHAGSPDSPPDPPTPRR